MFWHWNSLFDWSIQRLHFNLNLSLFFLMVQQ